MSDLMSLLSLGSAGITAQNSGVSIATNNVANANTVGYSRQRVDIESLLGAPNVGGVRTGPAQRLGDSILQQRIRGAASNLEMSRSFAASASSLEQSLAGGGDTIDQQLAAMFSRFGAVSASPTDLPARTAAVSSTGELVAGIGRRAAELDAQMTEANDRIRARAAEISDLARQLAETNLQIARTNNPVMKDERDRVATKLSALVGGNAKVDADGQMRFVLDGGAVLVDGQRAAKLGAKTDPVTQNVNVSVIDGNSERDVTTAIGGGSLGADLKLRDRTITGARTALDQLAFDITTSANAVHTAHAGADGVSGRPLFKPLGGVAGAAKAMGLDPDVEADPEKLALAAMGKGPGDNTGALAMFKLAQGKVASGGRTLTGAAQDLVTTVATEASRANADVTRDELVAEHLAGLRDSLSGVDIQEELTNLARFEHAASAMTKFVTTIDDMLGTLIDRL